MVDSFTDYFENVAKSLAKQIVSIVDPMSSDSSDNIIHDERSIK